MGTEYLSLNWRDINRRYLMRRGVAESEEGYKLLAAEQGAAHRLLAAAANSMLDPQVLLRAVRDTDGQVIDSAISPSMLPPARISDSTRTIWSATPQLRGIAKS